MSGIQRLNLMALMHVKDELKTHFAKAAVKYGLDKESANALMDMGVDEIVEAAGSTSEPVFILKPMMYELRAHAQGSEFHMLIATTKSMVQAY